MKKRVDNPTGAAIMGNLKKNFKETGLIVWVGSSEYWDRVYLHKMNHKLYIQVAPKVFEPIENFNIRKTETESIN